MSELLIRIFQMTEYLRFTSSLLIHKKSLFTFLIILDFTPNIMVCQAVIINITFSTKIEKNTLFFIANCSINYGSTICSYM